MKKMMAFSAVALCAAVSFGDVSSQNIVGYATSNAGSNLYNTWGTCFVSINAENAGCFRLGDLKLTGSTWGSDWLNFLDPATSIMDVSKNVTYYSAAEAVADGGSAEDAEWENGDEVCQDDVEYPFGTAFLTSFVSPGITMTYAGEVNANAELSTINCTGKPYAFVNNIYPADLTMGQIKLEGSTWGSDWLNFLDPQTSIMDVDRNITYYSAAEAIADGGSAEDAEWENGDEECKDDVELPMGQGFLCSFVSPNVKIIFPTYAPAK